MAARFPVPTFQFANSAGQPYAGGSLTFFQSGTSTPLGTFSDESLSTLNANPITLNSAGWPATAVFLQNRKYKVVLKDSSGSTIWTADPVSGTDFGSVPLWVSVAGNPNGSVAGTAASSGVLPSIAWDRTNNFLYVCVATGDASTAVWVGINTSTPTPVVTPPQGYLSLNPASSGTILAADVVAGTAVYYSPFTGNLVPLYNGATMVPTQFSELTLTLVASHAASQLYDVFVFNNSGTPTIVTGPAWTTPTAGSGARGTGAGTTQLSRVAGYWVNAVSMTGRNGATTYTIGSNLATYVGSLFMDGTNGQISCHVAWGQSRKWGVWNAYNRQRLLLQAGDATASWSYNTAAIRPSNNASTNSLTVFSGLAEEPYAVHFTQRVDMDSADGNPAIANAGIGWNSTSAMSGKVGNHRAEQGGPYGGDAKAEYFSAPSIGVNVATALENAVDTASVSMTWYGTNANMLLRAEWRG